MRSLACALLWLWLVPPARGASGWPQLQRDARHTGFTEDEPARPDFQPCGDLASRAGASRTSATWHIEFYGTEMISKTIQPIIVRGRLFFGTGKGSARAYDAVTGQELWGTKLDGPIFGSAAADQGKVFFATGWGTVFALDAATGAEVWKTSYGPPGFSASLVFAEGTLFIATREGLLLALDMSSGKERWRHDLGSTTFQTAAYADGVVYIGAQDMYVYAVAAKDGKRIWRSERLNGASMDYWFPVVHQGKVIVTTMQTYAGIAFGEQPKTYSPKVNAAMADASRKAAEIVRADPTKNRVREFLKLVPEMETFYVLDAATGKKAFVAPIRRSMVNAGAMYPPCVDADGNLLVIGQGSPEDWKRQRRTVILDLVSGDTKELPGPTPPGVELDDELSCMSVGGNKKFATHMHGPFGIKGDGLGRLAAPAISGDFVYMFYESTLLAFGGRRK